MFQSRRKGSHENTQEPEMCFQISFLLHDTMQFLSTKNKIFFPVVFCSLFWSSMIKLVLNIVSIHESSQLTAFISVFRIHTHAD